MEPEIDHFPDELVLRELGNYKWELVKPYRYITDSGIVITVPAGFVTDLYSTGVLRAFVGKTLDTNGPAVVHDYLFVAQFYSTRKEADEIMCEMIRNHHIEIPWIKHIFIDVGLQAGSWAAFNSAQRAHSAYSSQIDKILSHTDIIVLSRSRHKIKSAA